MRSCLICESDQLRSFFEGRIRMGSFGKLSESPQTVTECARCGARYLPPLMDDVGGYYRDGAYRDDLDQGNAIEKYFELTDDDQPYRLDILGPHTVRGRRVADVGCGAGPFLDLVKGSASGTIAIEPNEAYHDSLRERGHLVFGSVESLLSAGEAPADIAVSFSVLEHVENPREFLVGIRQLLRPDGRLLISTPNANDYMLELCPEYRSFFYRKVHLWYFTASALTRLANLSGFSRCDVQFKHRFDLSNALLWLRDKRPSGLGNIPLNVHLNNSWRDFLESSGGSDYLYAILQA